jgi:hypothetical protein
VVPLIKSKLISAKGPQDEVGKHGSGATTKLKDSYDEIVKRIEHILANAAETDGDCAGFDADTPSKNAHEITEQVRTVDWLRTLIGPLSRSAGAQKFESWQGSEVKTFSNDAPVVGSRAEIS